MSKQRAVPAVKSRKKNLYNLSLFVDPSALAEAVAMMRELVAKNGIADYENARNDAADELLAVVMDENELFIQMCDLLEEADPTSFACFQRTL